MKTFLETVGEMIAIFVEGCKTLVTIINRCDDTSQERIEK